MFIYKILRELFLGNLVSQLLRRTTYEDPIDNVKDIADNNITIVQIDYFYEIYRNLYRDQNTSEWNYVADSMVAGTNCGQEQCFNTLGSYQYFIRDGVIKYLKKTMKYEFNT